MHDDDFVNKYFNLYWNSAISQKADKTQGFNFDSLSIDERLNVLHCCIDYALDVGNKEEFMELTKEYNELKKEKMYKAVRWELN